MDKADFIVWASKLHAQYEPSDFVKNHIKNTHLLAIVGPTGVGKTTLIEQLGVQQVLSDVSRDPRPGEKDDKSYHFKNDYLGIISDIKKGNYAQYVISNSGEFYGTKVDEFPSNSVCTMAIIADAIEDFKKIGFGKITQIYVMPPSYVEWMRRIGGVRTKDLLYRISEARDSINMALEDENYNFVLNDTVESALKDIKDIMAGEEPNQHREELARGTANILLERIGEEL